MPQVDINAYERRPDWQEVCKSVSCTACGANVGNLCYAARGPNEHMNVGQMRSDFHHGRKLIAIERITANGKA